MRSFSLLLNSVCDQNASRSKSNYSFSAHNLMAVSMSGRPPTNSKNIHKAKCWENISIYIKTSVYTSFNVYSSRKPAATQEVYVLECWKQTSNACVQATESERWRTKPISRPCSGHSAKTRTLKTSCVLRPLECMQCIRRSGGCWLWRTRFQSLGLLKLKWYYIAYWRIHNIYVNEESHVQVKIQN